MHFNKEAWEVVESDFVENEEGGKYGAYLTQTLSKSVFP